MPITKLTKSNIDKLAKPEKGEVLYWDETLSGFGLRVATDRMSYIVQGRIGRGRHAESCRWTFGKGDKLTPDEARKQARQLLAGMERGEDPRDTKKTAGKGVTLRAVAEKYMVERSLADKTKADYHKMLTGPLSAWADKPLASITRDDVLGKFLAMKADAPVWANSTFQTLRAFFNFAINEWPDDFVRNPVQVLYKKWAPTKPSTDRIPDDKLVTVWRELQAAKEVARQTLEVTSIDFVSFLLLTGARLNEAAPLTWDRVNLAEGWWHIPSPKNGNEVWLPLATQAVEVLKQRPGLRGGRDYVFATPKGHITDPRKTMRNLSGVAGWELSPHDVRRTFVGVGIRLCDLPLWKVQALTNHKSKDVTLAVYNGMNHLEFLQPEVQQIADRITGMPTVRS